jgi:serine/threonine protein kinase
MTMPEFEKILDFRSKNTKLTLSLIMIMDLVHKGNILHNDISLSNILLHFPPNHIDRVYIGVCDCSLASHIVGDTFSIYDFPTRAEMERNKK